jgi:hypothetical protein
MFERPEFLFFYKQTGRGVSPHFPRPQAQNKIEILRKQNNLGI